uniref:Probable cysteine protease ATG4 n=1 Tax=Zeugodacus cucurbitae TaxID=28588 RepID=A0A0A1WVQ9_ZEUCU
MNQDALENVYYKNLGINSHPSAHEISMHVLRRQFSQTESNCEEDDGINLDWNYDQEDDLKEHLQTAEQLAVEQMEIPDEHFASKKPSETQIRRYGISHLQESFMAIEIPKMCCYYDEYDKLA